MTIAESRRLALFESIKTFLGEDNARTLMAYLPPDPDTVATKAHDSTDADPATAASHHDLIRHPTRRGKDRETAFSKRRKW
mgnify:CR=1 FL=1